MFIFIVLTPCRLNISCTFSVFFFFLSSLNINKKEFCNYSVDSKLPVDHLEFKLKQCNSNYIHNIDATRYCLFAFEEEF